jgi:Coenzyme PQQ synthesis protein D (PqqD)
LLTLNGSGARIWELLADGATAGAMIARLTDEFEAPEPLIRQEALAFLSQLEHEQIIRRTE